MMLFVCFAIKGQGNLILTASGVLCQSCYGAMMPERVLAKKSNLTFSAISPLVMMMMVLVLVLVLILMMPMIMMIMMFDGVLAKRASCLIQQSHHLSGHYCPKQDCTLGHILKGVS